MNFVYGLSLLIDKEIANDLEETSLKPDIKIFHWNNKNENITDLVNWYHHWYMPDGRLWLSSGKSQHDFYVLHFVDENLDFAISKDTSIIYYQYLEDFDPETIRHIILTQVLPMALNLRGTEAFHASSILSPSGAIALIGKTGYGKSTLAASLIKSGLKLISDNVVPVYINKNQIMTISGSPDIGLWPNVWQFLNPQAIIEDPTEKCRVVLSDKEHVKGNFPLSYIYLLNPLAKAKSITIESASQKESLMELLKASFRLDLNDSNMLKRQFSTLYDITQLVKIKKITYPESIPEPIKISNIIQSDISSFKRNEKITV